MPSRHDRVAAVQFVQRALARKAIRAQAVRLLEGLDRRRRLAGIASVDAPVVIAQLKQPRLQIVNVLAAVALVQRAVAAGAAVAVAALQLPLSFLSVLAPAVPSAVSPFRFWNAISAFCVSVPNTPSATPLR